MKWWQKSSQPAAALATLIVLCCQANATATAVRSSPPVQTPTPVAVSQSFGDLPAELAGVWLVVLNTQRGDRMVSNWHIFRITQREKKWTLQRAERPQGSPLDAIASTARQNNTELVVPPTVVEALKLVADELKFLSDADSYRAVALRTADRFLSEPPPPPAATGAKFSIEVLDHTQSSSVSSVGFYAKQIEPQQIRGDTHAFSLTAAGMSVTPIELQGTFRMHRLK